MKGYKRLTVRLANNEIGCLQEYRKDDLIQRLAELEDKIENGTLIELPCVAYNVKECRYQIISTKNGRVYVSKFYRDRKEAEAKLKELQEEQK